MIAAYCGEDAHPGTRASRPHHTPVRPQTSPPPGSTGICGVGLLGLAIAVHADRSADCLQPHADATSRPARNKVAGGTPALPGGVTPGAPRLPPTGSTAGFALVSPTPAQGGSDNRALNAAPGPIPGRDVIHVSGLLWRGCPPGNAGVPPAPLPGRASGISAAWFDRQRRRGSPRALPLRFTPTGWLTACNITLTLRHLQPGIRLRAGRPRSRGVSLPGRRVGPPTGSKTGSALSPTPAQGGSDNRALNAAPGLIPGRDVIHDCGLLWGGCPPGNAGVPPAPLTATASGISAAWFDRQRRRGSPRALPLRFTPTGWLTACNITLTLRHLQPGIRLRAGRPRSRGRHSRGAGVGPPSGSKTGSALSPTPAQGGSDNRALNAAPGPIPGRDVIHDCGLLWRGCPPGNAGVPPAPYPGTASDISAAWFDRHLRRGSPRPCHCGSRRQVR